MQPSTVEAQTTTLQTATKQEFIFVLQLHKWKIVIGKATNACKHISVLTRVCPHLSRRVSKLTASAVKPRDCRTDTT